MTAPPFACPACKGPVEEQPSAYCCCACNKTYPVLCGIADFRVAPDPYLSIEQDRSKGARLWQESEARGFAGLLDLYYSITPEAPAELVPKFRAHDLAASRIAEASLAEIPAPGPLLDIGCRSGGLLVAAAGRFPAVVGLDVAFRWLVIAQARLRETGGSATLVCANAEWLPFRDEAFGAVTAVDLLEHVADPAPVFAECRRVTATGGVCYFATNNRYSLLAEPHVNVWGVGWLPRPWQPAWVRLASGREYRLITLRSRRELGRLAAGFAACELAPAPLAAPGSSGRALAAYNRMRRWPGVSRLLGWVGPRLRLLCRR